MVVSRHGASNSRSRISRPLYTTLNGEIDVDCHPVCLKVTKFGFFSLLSSPVDDKGPCIIELAHLAQVGDIVTAIHNSYNLPFKSKLKICIDGVEVDTPFTTLDTFVRDRTKANVVFEVLESSENFNADPSPTISTPDTPDMLVDGHLTQDSTDMEVDEYVFKNNLSFPCLTNLNSSRPPAQIPTSTYIPYTAFSGLGHSLTSTAPPPYSIGSSLYKSPQPSVPWERTKDSHVIWDIDQMPKAPGLVGLQNLGNTCYLNSYACPCSHPL